MRSRAILEAFHRLLVIDVGVEAGTKAALAAWQVATDPTPLSSLDLGGVPLGLKAAITIVLSAAGFALVSKSRAGRRFRYCASGCMGLFFLAGAAAVGQRFAAGFMSPWLVGVLGWSMWGAVMSLQRDTEFSMLLALLSLVGGTMSEPAGCLSVLVAACCLGRVAGRSTKRRARPLRNVAAVVVLMAGLLAFDVIVGFPTNNPLVAPALGIVSVFAALSVAIAFGRTRITSLLCAPGLASVVAHYIT